jgi:hypothetical protein
MQKGNEEFNETPTVIPKKKRQIGTPMHTKMSNMNMNLEELD